MMGSNYVSHTIKIRPSGDPLGKYSIYIRSFEERSLEIVFIDNVEPEYEQTYIAKKKGKYLHVNGFIFPYSEVQEFLTKNHIKLK